MSLNVLISRCPIHLHNYNVSRSMSVPANPSLRFSQSQTPLAVRCPKLSRDGDIRIHRNSQNTANFTVRASSETSPPHLASSSNNSKLVFVSSAITVALAVANRVLYKLALVPMKQYPFFLAQFTTFGYVLFYFIFSFLGLIYWFNSINYDSNVKHRYVMIYFSILFMRYRAGIVTREMIGLPKSRFVAIGILEALGVATGMSSAGNFEFICSLFV